MRILFLIVFLLLTSCSTQPKIVRVPVAVDCPKPVMQPMPHLPVHDLHDNSTPPEVMKAWVATGMILNGSLQECRMRCGGEV